MNSIGYIGRRLLRTIVPSKIRFKLSRVRANNERYNKGSIADIFSAIYQDGLWGSGDDFYSGLGSHDFSITQPYVQAIRAFLTSLERPVDAVDLGCGDFAVGSQVRDLCNEYVACDVVPKLIDRNRIKFAEINVDFRVINLVEDDLPSGRVAFVRQVLQHLSNDQIANILGKLQCYEYVIVTEHIPHGFFVANVDKAAGPTVRTEIGSGIDLTAAPFNAYSAEESVLCEALDFSGCIRTVLYKDIRVG